MGVEQKLFSVYGKDVVKNAFLQKLKGKLRMGVGF